MIKTIIPHMQPHGVSSGGVGGGFWGVWGDWGGFCFTREG